MQKWPLVALTVLLGTLAGAAEAQSRLTVDTTADTVAFDGACSLREAIIASNLDRSGDLTATECSGSGIGDSISIRIAGGSVITVVSSLPQITDTVTISGPAGRVLLNGPATGGGIGLDIASTAPDTVVRRLAIRGFNVGIRVSGANSVIAGNYIGTDATGTTAVIGGVDILVMAIGVRIGGTTGVTPGGACTGDCNLIAGANVEGIQINNVSNTLIQGNMIGTNASGTAALRNAAGIRLVGTATATIGGTTAAASNLISGNGIGINFDASSSVVGSSMLGNRIGTNAAGTAALANEFAGINVNFLNVYPVVIGGTTAGAGNVISGNSGAGIRLANAAGVLIQGNRIGTRADGTTPLGNGGMGIELGNLTHDIAIGGDDAGAGNVIASNAVGVRVGVGDFDNMIVANSIHDNTGEGIQLDDGQNGTAPAPPAITGFNPVAGTSCAGCRVDLYSDTADEGRIHHGMATANGAGNWSVPGAIVGPNVTATATSSGGSTSEFSGPVFADSDGDALADGNDNCTLVANANQLDANQDGYGNLCDADLDNSSLVTVQDFNLFRTVLNQVSGSSALAAAADFDGSGLVTVQDYILLRSRLNQAPGPSGLACAGTVPCPGPG